MGYSTEFRGELKFNKPLNQNEIEKLQSYFGEDIRDHSDWIIPNPEFYFIDLIFNDGGDGIEWSGDEKTYSLDQQINFIIDQMKQEFPDFGLTGYIVAQGEDIDDRFIIFINDLGYADVKKYPDINGIQCPVCGHIINGLLL